VERTLAAVHRSEGGNRRDVLGLGIGLIALGLLLLLVPAVGFFSGPLVAGAGVVLLVLHFVRVSRATETSP
jgi:uncharacterized membrane protein HdeD (DUF308 family)